MQPTWVVVADRVCATIYTVPRGMARLRQFADLRHCPSAMNYDVNLACPRETRIAGRALDSVERQTGSFTRQLALYLEDARIERRYDELILVAAPALLANLRECLTQAVRDAIIAEIAKDLVGAQQESLQEQVLRVM